MNSDIYRQAQDAFDQIASVYDSTLSVNPIMQRMRETNLSVLKRAFNHPGTLLEIGCGTGDEAIALAKAGHQIIATDISTRMIEIARNKAGTRFPIEWYVMAAKDIGQLKQRYPGVIFNGVYASFGALNCEPDLPTFARSLAELLEPGGKFVCSMINRWCIWEVILGLLKRKPGLAFRRFRTGWQPTTLSSEGGDIELQMKYYTPKEFFSYFSPYFKLTNVQGMGIFFPPPHGTPKILLSPIVLNPLFSLERRFQQLISLANFGDHWIMTMQRVNPGGTSI